MELASYAQVSGVTTVKANLSDGKAALAALRTARSNIENAEANLATCYLFINPTVLGMIEDLDTTASKKAIEGFAGIIKVPKGRFYSKIDLTANGAGGYAKNTAGLDMNFLIVDKQAAIQFQNILFLRLSLRKQIRMRCMEFGTVLLELLNARTIRRWYLRAYGCGGISEVIL